MLPEKRSRWPKSSAELLDVIRRGEAGDWQSLCDYLGMPLSAIGTTNAGGWWLHEIENLHRTGFLQIDCSARAVNVSNHGPFLPSELNGSFIVTDSWLKMQSAFGIGLTDIANIKREGSTVVCPVFGRPDLDQALDVFIIMPFSKYLEPVYTDHIMSVCGDLKLSVRRADDLRSSQFIVNDIWRSLNSARVVIADCTGENPNVFYELGMAHTVGKPTIILTQDNDIPFDINHIQLIKYEYTPRGMKTCEDKIKDGLRYLLQIYD